MTSPSVYQPIGGLGHRPLSLLLQALKQIELKPPAELPPISRAEVDSPPATATAERTPANEVAASEGTPHADEAACRDKLLAAAAVTATSECQEIQAELPRSETFELVRRYHESETASEIVLANPVRVAAIPLADSSIEVLPAPRETRHDRRRLSFANDVVALLPNESPVVIALTAPDDIELGPMVSQLCEELAARGAGEVLAITHSGASLSRKTNTVPTLSDMVVGRGGWQNAVSVDAPAGFNTMERGDLQAFQPGVQRQLLRLWRELCGRFAFVVIDGSARHTTDAMPLLATCDATFIAVRLNETDRSDVSRLVEQIRSAGGYPCGCLVHCHNE